MTKDSQFELLEKSGYQSGQQFYGSLVRQERKYWLPSLVVFFVECLLAFYYHYQFGRTFVYGYAQEPLLYIMLVYYLLCIATIANGLFGKAYRSPCLLVHLLIYQLGAMLIVDIHFGYQLAKEWDTMWERAPYRYYYEQMVALIGLLTVYRLYAIFVIYRYRSAVNRRNDLDHHTFVGDACSC